jgi:hypothetical protein
MGEVGLRSISTLLLIALLLPLFTPVLIPVIYAQTENNIFMDNFEGYQVGSFPSAGEWEIVYDGMGQSYQVISTSYSYSPTKSFQLWGRTGWSSVVQRRFSTDSPMIGYELAVLIDERGSGYADHPAFFCKGCATWGAYYGTVLFDHGDGKIKAEDGTVLGSWSPRTWYRVKVVLDRQTNKYNVWINGELRGQNIPTGRSDTNRINAIALVSGWPGKKVYYDDVRVFIVVQQQSYLRVRLDSATLNGQGLSTSNPELRVNPGSRITGTVTFTVENVQPGSWITPVIWVTSWERGTVSNGMVRVVADDIRSTRQFTVNIDVTAPSSPGTYYIGFFAGWMYNADEVASNDHPPNYGDGDDVWDMPAQGWEEVISNGQALTGPYRMPGRAIRIVVQQPQEFRVEIVSYNAPSTASPGQTVSVQLTIRYSFSSTSYVGVTISRQLPDGSWERVWYNPDYQTQRSGQGTLTYTATFTVPNQPDTYRYMIRAQYWDGSRWIATDEKYFNIQVQQQQQLSVDVWTNKGGQGRGNLNGGQYTIGESITFYCSVNLNVDGLRIKVIRPDGVEVIALDRGPSSAGTYQASGTVGEPAGERRVICEARSGGQTSSDEVRFTVTQPPDTTPPTVRVIAPNGGETLFPGNVFRIRWEASDNVGVTKVHIWLFQGNEQVMVIARDLPNTGYYDWTVPNRPGTNYRIRIAAVDAAGNAGYDDSDGTFEIGGEVRVSAQIISLTTDKNQYNPGETVRIRYTIRNTGDVRIELRMVVEIVDPSGRSVYDSNRLGQDRRHDLDPGQTASGEFTWTIPADAVPGTYEVRASLRHWNIWDIVFDYRWGDRPGPRFTVQAAATATLQVGIRHTYIGDLKIWVGVEGGREVLIWNREGGGTRDLFREWNLLQLGFTVNDLPPSESKRWYLRIRDEAGGDEGRLEYFRIIYQGRTYESQDHPEIRDYQEVRAWIPSRGAPSLPDLTVRNVNFSPQTVSQGGSITVSWTEVNIGSGNAGPYRVGIYLGVSEYGRDHLLGSFNRDGLVAGGSRSYTQTFTIPSSVPPGSYYVTVFIDDLRAVSEANEENNIGSSTPNRLTVQQRLRIYWSKIYNVREDRNLVISLVGPDVVKVNERARFILSVAITYPDGRIVGLGENDIDPGLQTGIYLRDVSTFIGLSRRNGPNYFAPSDMPVPIIFFAKRLGPFGVGEPPSWYNYDYEKIVWMGQMRDLFNLGFLTAITVSFGIVFQHAMRSLQGLQNFLSFFANLLGIVTVPPSPPQSLLDINRYALLFGNWPLPPRFILNIAGYKVTAFTQFFDFEFITSGRNEIAMWVSVHVDVEQSADRYYVSDNDVIIIPIEVKP